MSLGYRYTVDDGACEILHRLPKRQRERVLDEFRRLAAHPFTSGDYSGTDARGVSYETSLFDERFVVSWHADHAVKQIRIIELEVV